MAETVYLLCFLTSAGVALLLLQAYAKTHMRILLWCGLGFIGLCLNNLLLVIDLLVVPDVDISWLRSIPALLGMLLLAFGLIWDAD